MPKLPDLKFYIERLTGDEALRAHMDDAYAAIWLHAAGEHLRQTARDGGDVAEAYEICRQTLVDLNDRLAKRQMRAIEKLAGGSSGFG